MTELTTHYLEMKSRSDLARVKDPGGLLIEECRIRQFEYNRFLYQFIGGPWQWIDKLSWPDDQWKRYVEDENTRTWVAYRKGAVAGYFELVKQEKGDVEIAYFGLSLNFIGKGLGGYLLSYAIEQAWQWPGTRRVWVHTCTLDHPGALSNYMARGMKVYRSETETA